MKYLDENPIDEVCRIRMEILNEHGGIKQYNNYLRQKRHKWIEMGFRFADNKNVQQNLLTESAKN